MYKIIYLRNVGNDRMEHREITCDAITDAYRIRRMLQSDAEAKDISVWQGATRLT